MQVQLSNIGRKFRKEWIFRNISENIQENAILAVIGPNGSGKSTLLKIISGSDLASEGKLKYILGNKEIAAEEIYKEVSYAAPYMDLPEHFTLMELLQFHQKIKGFGEEYNLDQVIEILYLHDSRNKFVKDFSSGMKQRLKLGLAILNKSSLLILDEPCSNLDEKGIAWYQEILINHSKNRLIFIGSNNHKAEIFLSTGKINLQDYKASGSF